MKETIKLGVILLLFTAAAGAVLAFSNSITEPIIAEQEKEGSLGALREIFEDADDFEAVEDSVLSDIQSEYESIVEIYEALVGDEVTGYALKSISGGYGGDITTVSGFNMDGTFAGIKVVDNSETPDLGTVIEEDYFSDSFKDKTTSEDLIAVDSPSADNEVQLLSGATISTNGVLSGVNKAREAFENYLAD